MPADAPIAILLVGTAILAIAMWRLIELLRDRKARRRRQRRRIRNLAYAWAWTNFFVRSPTKRLPAPDAATDRR